MIWKFVDLEMIFLNDLKTISKFSNRYIIKLMMCPLNTIHINTFFEHFP